MVRIAILDPLFQDFFQLFIFGQLFLSIFENLITFIKENCRQYILFDFEFKESLSSFKYTIFIVFIIPFFYMLFYK